MYEYDIPKYITFDLLLAHKNAGVFEEIQNEVEATTGAEMTEEVME